MMKTTSFLSSVISTFPPSVGLQMQFILVVHHVLQKVRTSCWTSILRICAPTTLVILQPTRADNILDLYISNSEDLVSHVSVSDTVLSDHRLVEIILSYNPCSFVPSSPPDFFNSSFRSLDFHKADFNSINEKLSSVD